MLFLKLKKLPMHCPFCNSEINQTQTFCYSCGKSLFEFRHSEEMSTAGTQEIKDNKAAQEAAKAVPMKSQESTSSNTPFQQAAKDSYQTLIPKPNNNIVLSVICMLMCCMPLGVISLVYALKVDSNYQMGQYAEAVKNSELAKKWALGGIIGGVVIFGIYIIFVALLSVVGEL